MWVDVGCLFSPAESFPWAMAEDLVPGPQCKTVIGLVCSVFQQKPTRADKTLRNRDPCSMKV